MDSKLDKGVGVRVKVTVYFLDLNRNIYFHGARYK